MKIRLWETIAPHSAIKNTDKRKRNFWSIFGNTFRLEIGNLVRKINKHIGKGNH